MGLAFCRSCDDEEVDDDDEEEEEAAGLYHVVLRPGLEQAL